jgi:Flp pilus assembly protein TadD
VGDTELGLGHFEAAIEEYHNALDLGARMFFIHTNLAAAYPLAGKMDEAKTELAEARRLNPASHHLRTPACYNTRAERQSNRPCGR